MTMTVQSVQSATLDLLLRVNRLLAEADAVRELRDRLVEAARDTLPQSKAETPKKTRKAVARAN